MSTTSFIPTNSALYNKNGREKGLYSKGQFLRLNRISYLPTGKGQRKQLQSLSSFLDKHCICVHRCYFIWRYVCYRKRDIFSLTLKCDITSRFALQMCGRLRYDINPFTPERAYRIEDISHAARVYRKSRKGFISLRSVLKGTTLNGRIFYLLCLRGVFRAAKNAHRAEIMTYAA